ncbi:competence protein CoiA family protein [Alkalibacillus haloalkaliphilus]|uniref:Competence protein CoiA-like N-terminal domain-containing protein n=1 Tax=Alkalibacillus haloalkaliphilus TaxID=94136 RepID=A0A511W5T2_9BACI|nr:competence protein CoiA family protein [Alkalibacillus haloalkaliphilus]GEN45403.1 hypothetical protein AHA02nite_11790 [Alkalibacillus haloalkaliphilus]
MDVKLPFGLRNDRLVYIDDVKRGLACGCVCPSCKQPLIAKKGPKTVHHFSHSNENCNNAFETALHIAAKDILNQNRKIIIPKVRWRIEGTNNYWTLTEEKELNFDEVILESYQDGVIPDVFVVINGKKLMIEITVTHETSQLKIEKVRRKGVSILEIDLKEYKRNFIKEKLDDDIINNPSNKKWMLNMELEKIETLSKNRNVVQYLNCYYNNNYYEQDPSSNFGPRCPKENGDRISYEKCSECEFCMGILLEEKFIKCSYKSRIKSYKDLKNYARNPSAYLDKIEREEQLKLELIDEMIEIHKDLRLYINSKELNKKSFNDIKQLHKSTLDHHYKRNQLTLF